MNFNGKNILIVGASSGVGYDLASKLLGMGATVFSASRRQPEGLAVQHFPLDVLHFQGNELDGLPDTLHGVAYCPGSITLKPFQRLTASDFEADFAVNVLGAVQAIQAVTRQLKKSGSASIVLFSTVAVQTGMGFHASIAAAKGAVEGLTRSLAAEFAPANIRCNAIAPSLTDTPLAAQLLADDKKREASAKRHPLNRVGSPNDLSSLAAFLLSEDASWLTGQIIGADGGMSSVRTL